MVPHIASVTHVHHIGLQVKIQIDGFREVIGKKTLIRAIIRLLIRWDIHTYTVAACIAASSVALCRSNQDLDRRPIRVGAEDSHPRSDWPNNTVMERHVRYSPFTIRPIKLPGHWPPVVGCFRVSPGNAPRSARISHISFASSKIRNLSPRTLSFHDRVAGL